MSEKSVVLDPNLWVTPKFMGTKRMHLHRVMAKIRQTMSTAHLVLLVLLSSLLAFVLLKTATNPHAAGMLGVFGISIMLRVGFRSSTAASWFLAIGCAFVEGVCVVADAIRPLEVMAAEAKWGVRDGAYVISIAWFLGGVAYGLQPLPAHILLRLHLTGTLLLALRTLVWYYRVEEERLLTTALPSTAGAFLTGGLLAKLLKTLAPLHEIVLQLEQIERSLTASQGTWSALLRDYGMLAEERLQASDSDVPGTFARPRSSALADGGTRSCVICMQHQRTHTYLPCMHRCVCAECADRWAAACPLCRESATGCARVYD